MLYIYFGDMDKVNYGPSWFRNNYNLEWLKDAFVQKMIEDARVEAHFAGYEAVVDEGVIVGYIRVDSETDHIDAVAVVDPYEIDVVDAVLHVVHAGAGKVVSRAGGNESENIFCADKVIEQAVDRAVSADGRDDIFCVLKA